MSDKQQIVDRTGVGDNDLHPSQAQTLQAFNLPPKVFQRVVDPDLVRLQEPIQLMARCETEKTAQPTLSQAAALIFFQTKCLQCPARQVPACGAQLADDIVGDFNGEIHVALPLSLVCLLFALANAPFSASTRLGHQAARAHRLASKRGSEAV